MIDRWLETRLGGVRYTAVQSEAKVCCPFCKARSGVEDTGYHLYVSTVEPVAHCFRCDWSGSHVSLVMSVEGCSYPAALANIDNPPPDISKFDEVAKPKGIEPEEAHPLVPEGFIPTLSREYNALEEWKRLAEAAAVWRYLVRRDVPDDLIRSGRFGCVPGTNRVWIIVDDYWWQGRLIIPGKPKYISPPWSRGQSLWNARALRPGKSIVICEGVFSAIAVGPHAIAICSKTMTGLQVDRVVKASPSSIVIMLDAGTWDEAWAMADTLTASGYPGAIYIQFMESGDPADGVVGDLVQWGWDSRMKLNLTTLHT